MRHESTKVTQSVQICGATLLILYHLQSDKKKKPKDVSFKVVLPRWLISPSSLLGHHAIKEKVMGIEGRGVAFPFYWKPLHI
jgi:hypothetical protein